MNKEDKTRFNALARSLGVTIAYDAKSPETEDGDGPWTCVEDRTIHLYPDTSIVCTDGTFLAAMHELGHIETTPPGAVSQFPPELFITESKAWEWAIKNMGRPMTLWDREVVAANLGTYMVGSANDFGTYPFSTKLMHESVKFVAEVTGVIDFSTSKYMQTMPGEFSKHLSDFSNAWTTLLDTVKYKGASA